MAARILTKGERTQRRIAASYRKQGYRVVVPTAAEALPAFLHDCHPDLIAERDDDRVVVEIKRAGSLKGANDLVELAQRVERQPGWRLELVTYKDRDPDATLISSQWLHQILAPGNDALTCIYRLEVVGSLLRGIALRAGKTVRNKTETAIANELAFEGLIDGPVSDRIDDAYRWKADLMRGRAPSPPAAVLATELEALCRELFAQAQQTED